MAEEKTKEERELQLRKEEFLGWMEHPVTQAFRKMLERLREEERDKWEDGLLTAESKDGTLQLNAEAIGRCRTLATLLGWDGDDYQQELEEDGKSERAGA